MFEKLSSAIKKATNKIASAIFVDKKLIDEIIKDLQRALIEADVNVLLVKQISDELRQKAIDEKIKGVEKKEHIIKLLHDKLLEILGGEKKEPVLEKGKNTKIMLLGLYGSGKCIHANSNIQLANGDIIRIEDLYEKHKINFKEESLEDGKIINISDANLFVPSFNQTTAKIENKRATHLWRLKKKDLMEIKADNGNDFSIKVTPEHPFFALRNGQIIQIRADELTENDFIALPKDIEIKGNTICLFKQLKQLNLLVYLNNEEVKELIKNKEIKDICVGLKLKKNCCYLTSLIKKGVVPIELLQKNNYNFLKIKNYQSKKIITIPTFMTSEFAEFLGYLMGDGHIGKGYIEIVTEDTEVIERIVYLSKSLFNLDVKPERDLRTRAMFKLKLTSTTLVRSLSIFNLKPGKKGKGLMIPKEILLSDNETIRKFIKAYFDCDSHASQNRNIELSSESNILIRQMILLLNRFGIASTISKKIINNIPYWRLLIKSKFAELYADKIGYLIGRKKRIVDNYKVIGINQGCGDQNMLPLGKLLKEIREKLGFSIGEIQANVVRSYGRYEESGFISREHLKKLVEYYKIKKYGRFFQILDSLSNNENIYKKYSREIVNGLICFLRNQGVVCKENNQIILTKQGINKLQLIKNSNLAEIINNLEILSKSNIFWSPVKEINNITNDNEVVYDLTVEDNHSFIADGFIVHNTTTCAKLANYYTKRGLRTCLLGLDVHRPAAREQLEQLGQTNSLKVFINKQENKADKIYEQFSDELKEYDLTIIDTAGRHSLDKELVDEIKTLGKKIKPDYIILVIAADIGQAAKKLASEFQQTLKINGVIITRMDSSAKGGGALTACSETKAPVFFITTGEKINDIESFNPENFLSRILGLGDLEALMEKISLVVDKDKAKLQEARLKEGKFSMYDLYEQLKSMDSFSLSKITELIPGFSKKIPEDLLGNQQEKMKKWKYAIDSMTQEEKENPEILEKQTSRISRIAKGAGLATSDVRALLKQYDLLKDFLKSGQDFDANKGMQGFSQKQLQKIARKFGKKIRL